jgi:hypothetical protein
LPRIGVAKSEVRGQKSGLGPTHSRRDLRSGHPLPLGPMELSGHWLEQQVIGWNNLLLESRSRKIPEGR